MAQVEVTVNGRIYKITCDDGQEQRLQQLAGYYDRHVSKLSAEPAQTSDPRRFLLAALTVCDELFEARRRLSDVETGADPLDAGTIGGASRVIDAATRRVNAIAEKVAQG